MNARALKLGGLAAALIGGLALAAPAQAARVNGTTISAIKTIDICDTGTTLNGTPQWRYSGEISVANGGAIATKGLNIFDAIQTKQGGMQFADIPGLNQLVVDKMSVNPVNLLPGTQMTFTYNIQGNAIPVGPIRNRAKVTITNHSKYLGQDFGPEPKTTWGGTDPVTLANTPPACNPGPDPGPDYGCTLTQGYWKNHEDVWPAPYAPGDTFYLSGKTYDGVLNTTPGTGSTGSGYYILAHQFIAAQLNIASGAGAPQGVQQAMSDALAFFQAYTPSYCTAGNFYCNLQKATAAVLDDYNNGRYPDGPPHCGG